MQDGEFSGDVLVVGYGPTGAALAGLLARQGVSVLVAERALELHHLPRAVHFDSEVMRIFQSLGVADGVRPHAVEAADYEFRNAVGEVLFSIPPSSRTPNGWASGYMVHQPGMETALRSSVETHAMAEIWLGHSFASLEQDAGGVTTTLLGPGGSRQVRSRFVVACDGGASPVREAVGIGLEDFAFDEPWLVVDVKLGATSHVPDVNIQCCDPARPTTCVQSGPGRHRWEFMMMPGERSADVLAPGFAEKLIAAWHCGDDMLVERKAVYRFHGLIARSWRCNRVFLAGDAAHQMPPMAGQGMCSGIRDAYNLAWKMAAVLGGHAGSSLLDTYEAERVPHAREVIETAIHLGRVVCTIDPGVASARDAQMLAARAAGHPPPALSFAPFKTGLLLAASPGAGMLLPQPAPQAGSAVTCQLDDVLGLGACLISRGSEAALPDAAVALRSLAEPAIAPFAVQLQAWLDGHNAASVLVRPDRVVFGTGQPDVLLRAYQAALAGTPALRDA